MKLSLVLPSLFPNAAHRAIANLRATTRGVDYEILAVTPFEISGPNIRWIREEAPRGVIPAHAAAYAAMTGDMLVALADDVILADNWAAAALATFREREAGRSHFCLGLHQTNFVLSTVFGIYFPFFAVIRRPTLAAIGGYYDPIFVAHYADPDLALRVWKAGGRCERTPIPLISRVDREGVEAVDPPVRSSASAERAKAVFAERWASTYGRGWSMAVREDFNIDIDAVFELVVGEDLSVFLNDPIFKTLHRNYAANVARWQVKGPGVVAPQSAEQRPTGGS
jgi:hypothetical protein